MRVLSDFVCEDCDIVYECMWCPESDKNEIPICPICDEPLKRQIGKFFVINKKKGQWNK